MFLKKLSCRPRLTERTCQVTCLWQACLVTQTPLWDRFHPEDSRAFWPQSNRKGEGWKKHISVDRNTVGFRLAMMTPPGLARFAALVDDADIS